MASEPAHSSKEAQKVRDAVGAFWRNVLGDLAAERKAILGKGGHLPKSFVEKLRMASDQLRRDYRLEPDTHGEDSQVAPAPADPLDGLTIYRGDDAA